MTDARTLVVDGHRIAVLALIPGGGHGCGLFSRHCARPAACRSFTAERADAKRAESQYKNLRALRVLCGAKRLASAAEAGVPWCRNAP